MTLGPRLGEHHHDAVRYALSLHPQGWAVEFGVASGGTLRIIARHMPVIGFDSFQGLPEDWREGFPAGTFAGEWPNFDAQLVVGMFADTLPTWEPPGPIGLVHIDCDLYSSTATVLRHVGPLLEPGCLIVFDEYHGYDGWENHEARAWSEWTTETGRSWEPLGHGPEQLVVRLLP